MTTKYIALTMLACAGAWAADYKPMDVKTGEWENTVTNHVTGVPAIPEEALRHMTPEQRARFEAAIKGSSGRAITSKSCLTKKQLAEGWNAVEQTGKGCTTVLTKSTSTKQEIQVTCDRGGMKGSGTVTIEATDSEHIHGTGKVTATGDSNAGQPMNISYELTGKWIGPACTEK